MELNQDAYEQGRTLLWKWSKEHTLRLSSAIEFVMPLVFLPCVRLQAIVFIRLRADLMVLSDLVKYPLAVGKQLADQLNVPHMQSALFHIYMRQTRFLMLE